MTKEGAEFDRSDLVREIVARYGGAIADAKTPDEATLLVLKAFSAILPDALAKFGRVELHDIGTFTIEARQRKTGEDEEGNPMFEPTGVDKIAFRPASFIASLVSSRTGRPLE